ncbi:hypothetical protein BM531_22350, partial [Clostridioides difficile]
IPNCFFRSFIEILKELYTVAIVHMITKIVTAIIIDFIELFIFEYLLAPCNLNKCSLYFIISETASLSLFEYIFLLIYYLSYT